MDCKEIQAALFTHYLRSDIVICPNTEALYHEADLVLLMPSGMVTEIEIKVSRSDFKADFKKVAKHGLLQSATGRIWGDYYCANSLYYACPEGLIRPDEVPKYAGLLYIVENHEECTDTVVVAKPAPRLHSNKWPAEKLLRRLARSLMYKVFNAGNQALPEHAHLQCQAEAASSYHDAGAAAAGHAS